MEVETAPPSPPSSPFEVGVRAVQIAAGLMIGAGVYTVVEAMRRGSGLLVPVALVVVATAGVALTGAVVRRLRERRRRRAVDGIRHDVADRLRRELDRRIGRRVREVLRRRAEGGAAYAAFQVALSEVVTELPPSELPARERRRADTTAPAAHRRPG